MLSPNHKSNYNQNYRFDIRRNMKLTASGYVDAQLQRGLLFGGMALTPEKVFVFFFGTLSLPALIGRKTFIFCFISVAYPWNIFPFF